MWNLFCRLSVNKLCGSLQAAYLTLSVRFAHTRSAAFTHAASRGPQSGLETRCFQCGPTKDSLITFSAASSDTECQRPVKRRSLLSAASILHGELKILRVFTSTASSVEAEGEHT